MDDIPRRRPCHILRRYKIPSVVWFEDALEEHGVPTLLFDLYILVPNIEIAAHLLEQNGWKPIPQQLGRIGHAILDLTLHPQLCLAPPHEAPLDQAPTHSKPVLPSDYGLSTVVLLPAAEWNFDFERNAHLTVFLPPLEDLFDGLLKSLLDCSQLDLQDQLDLYLAYLYGHVPQLKERAFADGLLYEHRQYHFDVLSGMNYGTVPFVAHQRQIRRALREGDYELRECSSTRDNQDLFNHAVQARLLASLPPPHGEDTEALDEIYEGSENKQTSIITSD